MTVDNGPTTHYALDGQSVVQEGHISNGQFVSDATYLIGPRGPEYRRDDDTGEVRWYIYDGLGSVLGEVDEYGVVNPDSQGNPTPLRKYDVYGFERNSGAAPGTSDHRFVGSLGHASEAKTGLIYMRARYMDPALGRFISEDPAGDGVNWFVYCRNNPVNMVDQDGRAAAPVVLTVAGIAIAYLGAALVIADLYGFPTSDKTKQFGLALTLAGGAIAAAGTLFLLAGAAGSVATGGLGTSLAFGMALSVSITAFDVFSICAIHQLVIAIMMDSLEENSGGF